MLVVCREQTLRAGHNTRPRNTTYTQPLQPLKCLLEGMCTDVGQIKMFVFVFV